MTNIFRRLSALLGRRRERQIENMVGMIVSARDTEQSFQNQVDNSLLLRFFLNEEDACIPHRHETVVDFTDEEIEKYHDFIQWIFPTSQPSSVNWRAPIIDAHFAAMLHSNPCALQNYCKSCRRYLRYMDFDCNGEGNINIHTYRGDRPFYGLPYHNFLRMTRMLQSLRETGHPQCSANLFAQMMTILRATPDHPVSNTTIAYWQGTQPNLSRITPDYISDLRPNEVFVFGSNVRGKHYGGAAAFAVKRFGAIMGQGEGLQGQSYAIPTMEGMENMRAAVDRFIAFAQEHPELIFLVTPIGCGIAGYTPEDIAPLFAAAKTLDNVHLPNSFWVV